VGVDQRCGDSDGADPELLRGTLSDQRRIRSMGCYISQSNRARNPDSTEAVECATRSVGRGENPIQSDGNRPWSWSTAATNSG